MIKKKKEIKKKRLQANEASGYLGARLRNSRAAYYQEITVIGEYHPRLLGTKTLIAHSSYLHFW